MKKILFILMSLNYGGAERSLLNLVQVLPRGRYDISLLVFQKTGALLSQIPPYVDILETPKDLCQLYGSPKKAGAMLPVKLLGTAAGRAMDGGNASGHVYRWNHIYKKVLHPLKDSFDIAVAYLEGEPVYYLADFVNAARKIAFIHNDYKTSGMRRENDLPAFLKMDAIVTISETCLTSLKEAFPQIRDRMVYVQNITSAASIREKASNAEAPSELDSSSFNLLSVGRLQEQKGFDFAIDAARILKEHHRKFRWLVLGDGVERENLQQQIVQNDVGDCFILAGSRQNPYVYMKHADLLVQPSRWEGKSIVLDEAKMIGVPILATRYNTVGNQLTDGQDGRIVSMDARSIAAGIEELMDHQEKREDMKAWQLAHDYDNTAEVEHYLELFEEK